MPWTQNLSVGISMIDDQHKMWFEKAEALFDAGKNNKAKEYVGELLDFLESYTKKAFRRRGSLHAEDSIPWICRAETGSYCLYCPAFQA
jgi:hemerythrin